MVSSTWLQISKINAATKIAHKTLRFRPEVTTLYLSPTFIVLSQKEILSPKKYRKCIF